MDIRKTNLASVYIHFYAREEAADKSQSEIISVVDFSLRKDGLFSATKKECVNFAD